MPTARLSGRRQRIILEGDVPSPINPPGSCHFMGRCAYRQDECLEGTPPLTEYEPGHFVACRFAGRLTRSRSS